MTPELRTFELGMDRDTSPLLIGQGQYRYALNVYNGHTGSGKDGALVIERGNKALEWQLPQGINKAIGGCENVEDNTVIAFIYNSEGNHSILEISVTQETVQVVVQGPILNFQPTNRIHGADIIGGLLYWTDGFFDTYALQAFPGITEVGFNPPRKINIEKAKNGEYPEIDFQTLDRIKWPPSAAPRAAYFTNEDRASNFMDSFLFQFRYRYVYDDYERSVWSPISATPLPPNIETAEGRNVVNPSLDNEIRVTVNAGHHTVRRIEVAARIGNSRPFFVFEDLDKSDYDDFEEVVVVFTNNSQKRVLSEEENGKNWDRVPQISHDQEIVEGNRLVDANIIEGYDSVPLYVENGYGDGNDIYSRAYYHRRRVEIAEEVSASWINDDYLDQSRTGITLPDYTQITVGTIVTFFIGGIEYVYTLDYDLPSQFSLWFYLGRYLEQQGFNVSGIYEANVPGGYSATNPYYSGEILTITWGSISDFPISPFNGVFFLIAGQSVEPFKRLPSLKSGTYHPIGLVYTDRAGRPGTVQTSESLNVYVPFYTEETFGLQGQIYSNRPVIYDLELGIRHKPPVWATGWKIVRQNKARILSFGHYSVRKSLLASNSRLQLFLDLFSLNLNSNIQHEVAVGDVVRIITKGEDYPADSFFAEDYIELRVTKWFPDQNAIEVSFDGNMSDLSSSLSSNGCLVEIYTPASIQDSDDVFWREIGQDHPIINPYTEERYHGFDENIVSFGEILENDFGGYTTYVRVPSAGDVYIKQRFMRDGLVNGDVEGSGPVRRYWVEDYHFSDYYYSDWHSYGRLHTLDQDAKRLELKTGMVYSDVFRQNTQVNGLSTVDASNFDSVKDVDGAISRIIEVGFTLKVYQEYRQTSIYLSRSEFFSSGQGGSNIVRSDNVLGSKNSSEEDWGTIHPESVIKMDRDVYFYDANNAAIIRDSPNGMLPISKGRIEADLQEWSKRVLELGTVDVVAGIDKDKDRVSFTFAYNNPLQSVVGVDFEDFTISYCTREGQQKWVGFHSWIPEECLNRGSQMIVFKNGVPYLQNQGDDFTFFGEKYASTVSVIFNAVPTAKKIFLSLATESDDLWIAPEKGDIKVLEAVPFDGPETRIKAGRWKIDQGTWFAEIPRDMNTPVENALINGGPMRGLALQATLTNNAESSVYLLGVRCNHIKSERSER